MRAGKGPTFHSPCKSPPKGADAQPSPDAELVNNLIKSQPQPIIAPVDFHVAEGNVQFSIKLPKPLTGTPKSVLFFPVTDGIIANNAEQQFTVNGDMLSFAIKQGEITSLDKGESWVSIVDAEGQHQDYVIALQKSAATISLGGAGTVTPEKSSSPQSAPAADLTFISALLFAVLGGLVLNLMPCVLPILSLKVLSVAKKAKSEASHVRAQALAYTAGVILSFMLLAVILISLQKIAGESLGWGFQMQSPVFVAFLSVLMLLVALNLSGAFELPVLFGNVGGETIAKDNALGSFLTGVLAVMVATPCSAPFMAPAIGFALTQGVGVVVIVFAALGLGLAAPFLLLSVFPGLASLLPKPGAWMLVLRQFLAFPIYLTVVWLLWVLTGEAGATGAGLAMLAMVAAGFCVFLLQRQSTFLRLLGLVIAAATVWAVIHMIAPSMQTATAVSELSEPFSVSRLDELRKAGKPVFVDATADWCITCKVNEAVALSKPEVKEAFEKQHIITLVADWTRGDMAITEYLKSFERSGVPIYVYYPASGAAAKVLPQILTPSIVVDAVHE